MSLLDLRVKFLEEKIAIQEVILASYEGKVPAPLVPSKAMLLAAEKANQKGMISYERAYMAMLGVI